ncbi:DnaB-like helicase N-terminal domain-containing protein [Acinetobacter phage Ab69]|nr:DnaB-like helicase N-terminal domain-containing protein [Acinetobacter phage Ab69]
MMKNSASLDVKPCLDDFYSDRHKEIFKAIETNACLENHLIKSQCLRFFKDFRKLDLIGGEEYLLKCVPCLLLHLPGFYIEKQKTR